VIHPQALVDPTAKLGKEVHIGPFSVIGANVEMGDNT
jgi:UDP-N-acetylglucosamine acyltransferase